MAKKKKTFEEKLSRLEEIVDILDSGEEPLEELLKYYEEGAALAKELRLFLDSAEQKIIDITKESEIEDDGVDIA